MKIVNSWNTENIWNGSKYVNDDYQLKVNETFDLIPQGANQPVKRVNDSWVGADQPKFEIKEREPTAGDKALNALGLQLAQIQKTQATQAQAINALGLQLAASQQNDVNETK